MTNLVFQTESSSEDIIKNESYLIKMRHYVSENTPNKVKQTRAPTFTES